MAGTPKQHDTARRATDRIRHFPGMLQSWDSAIGKQVADVHVVDPDLFALEFEDGSFALVRSLIDDPAMMQRGIDALHPMLERNYADALSELARYQDQGSEARRRIRVERILDAIADNIDAMPELYDHIPSLLERLRGGATDAAGASGARQE